MDVDDSGLDKSDEVELKQEIVLAEAEKVEIKKDTPPAKMHSKAAFVEKEIKATWSFQKEEAEFDKLVYKRVLYFSVRESEYFGFQICGQTM